ncbi:MAG: protease modulator HflC [Gammaproteobacteria bacterium]|jgi:membrane protease subunit HflC
MSSRGTLIFAGAIVILIIAYFSTFTVSEKEYAIRIAVGKFDKSDFEPGLHFKIPVYHEVIKYDKRILSYDAPKQRYLTKDNEPLDVDYYAKWRIVDVETYYKKLSGSEALARQRFDNIINRGLLDAFGKRTMWELISDERADVMSQITNKADEQIREFGVQIVDVRVKRIEMPDNIRNEIYNRMITERKKEAAKFRAEGIGTATQIKAQAEKESQILLAKAYEAAQKIRGKGDAEAARIYADAYNKNAEFFSFYRSLQAYRESFEDSDQVMVLEPDSEFFKYFKQMKPTK